MTFRSRGSTKMTDKRILHGFLLLITGLAYFGFIADSLRVTLKDLRCQNLDEKVLQIEECGMRGRRNGFLTVKLLRVINNCSLSGKFLKKSNKDFIPYFAKEFTVDGCEFLKWRYVPTVKYVFSILEPYTNVNHSCPYQGEIWIRDFKIDQKKVKYMPLPKGEYAFYTKWYHLNSPIADFRVFIMVD